MRDPVFFCLVDPGSSIGKIQTGSGMNIPDHITESLEPFFGLKYLNSLMWMRIRDPEIFLTLDPGWKNSDPG
jgi:hypothetical protein